MKRTPCSCAFLLLSGLATFALAGCERAAPHRRQGYLEGEYVYIAAPHAGALAQLHVQRGTVVERGARLFTLDPNPQAAARDEAERRVLHARATLADLQQGQRASEIEALTARLRQAEVALQFSEKELARAEKLVHEGGVASEQDFDRARSARDQDRQRVAQLTAELATAQLGARADQVAAAEANVRAAESVLARAAWDLAQKQQVAPQAGLVVDVLYREGEWVAAGRPVVVLLPPANIKLRVFVAESHLAALQVGDSVTVFMDGRTDGLPAKVTYLAPEAEYSPPIVYSRANRQKFVYLVEAAFAPEVAAQLHPGQPVEVELPARQP
jgi:HlyD family secretion protein